ncbi:MAG: glycosyltransferase [Rhodospirillaceae bacterium]|nr:glycosyltransferase [Rhodospirillaceae bacterium]
MAFIAGFSLLAWCYLAFFHRDFWRGDQRLPPALSPPETWPAVTAIVPARNEAETIEACVRALRGQIYQGELRIIVVDDSSTDDTAALARVAGATAPGTAKVEVITAPPLPQGWTGKLAALNAGLTHAGDTEFVWFTDADVVHAPSTLTRLAAMAVTNKRDLVSLMVRLRCRSPWEHLLIPAFIYFFQMLYPFAAANDPRSRVAAAAGGCVLVRRARLIAAGGLEAIKGEIIDDCALARIVKRAGGRPWLALADDSHSLRAADSLDPLWTMVKRTAFTQLGYSRLQLAFSVAGLALVFLGPAFVVLTSLWHGKVLATLAGFVALGLMLWTYRPTLLDYQRSPWEGLRLPLAAALYCAMTIDSALAHGRNQGGQWKGRNYGPSAAPSDLAKSL